MTTILVPTDFSETAANASVYAAALAKEMGYDLLLLHIYNPPIIISAEMSGTVMIDTVQLEKDIRIRLKKEAEFLAKKSGVAVNYKAREGTVVEEIISVEKDQEPGLIVMGLKADGAVNEFIVGSSATQILRKVHAPLIIVPEKATFKSIERIAFANDHKIEADLAMNSPVKDIIEKFRSRIYILSVVKENQAIETDKKIAERRIEKYFENMLHSYHFIENNDVVEGINEFIDLHKIDLVTMLPHKHNLFEKLFNAGFTKELAFHTHIPLLSLSNNVFKA